MNQQQKEKEQAQKIKALRRELEDKMTEQLPPEMLEESIPVEVQKINDEEARDPERAKRILEALLFASNKPLMISEMRKVLKVLTPSQIGGLLSDLKADYARENHSFELIEIANGYEIATRKDYAPWLMKLELQKKMRQVTQSALETLAIMAYKQPITRAEIEELRGVDASGVVNTLMERNFIKIVGKKEVPGRPFLYGTTEKFLEHFGLKSIQDLPSIDEIRTVVENSVKKDELLGKTNLVDVPAETSEAGEAASEAAPQPAEEEETAQETSAVISEEAVSDHVEAETNENQAADETAVAEPIQENGENHEPESNPQQN